MISAVNGRKRALLTKSALEWHNKRCTAQSTLCVGNKKGKTELKAMCDFFFFLVSRYLGHDTIHVSPAQVSRCIDASMHRYALTYVWLFPLPMYGCFLCLCVVVSFAYVVVSFAYVWLFPLPMCGCFLCLCVVVSFAYVWLFPLPVHAYLHLLMLLRVWWFFVLCVHFVLFTQVLARTKLKRKSSSNSPNSPR